MAYSFTENRIGLPPMTDTGTTALVSIGTIARAVDPTYGAGEFIYLLGVASTVAGSVVTYNATTGQTTLAAAGTNIPQPIAIAMSANVASQYGWYQIAGQAVAAKQNVTASFAAGNAVGITATGVLSNTATGAEVFGAVAMAAATATATTVQVLLNRPHLQGRIT